MADQTTSWILELVDKVTKPIKAIVNSVSGMTEAVEDMTETVRLNERETREALTKAKAHYKELEGQIKDVEKELKELERVKENGDWAEAMEATRAFDRATQRVERLRTALHGAEGDVNELTDAVQEFNERSQQWTDVATGINQGIELIQKATDGLEFTVDIANLTNEVQRMTDLTGKALDEFVKKTRNIAAVYDQEAEEIARATNAMTKQNGGSYEENFKLIEEGFKRGANANGDFIDQLLEYQPFIKQLGLTQSQAIAMIAKSGKEGIYDDKAIDSLKEANMALREMGKSQVDALAGIGMKPDDLVGKTTIEAIQMISKKMKGATSQARQLVLADIFKGAGEDAGLAWADELGNADFDLTKLPSVEQAGAGIKGFFADISTQIGQSFGNLGVFAAEISPIIQTVVGLVATIAMLSKVTWIQTAATKAWAGIQVVFNAIMSANPVAIIILAIIALIAAIAWVANSTTGWGEAWDHVMNAAGFIFDGFVSGVKTAFNTVVNGIMIGINKIKEGWYEFKDAVGIGDSDENQKMLAEIQADTEARKEEIRAGIQETIDYGIKATAEMAAAVGSIKMKPSDEKEEEGAPSVNEYATGSPDVLGKIAPDGKKKKGGKEGDGLNVGSGSGGIKSITMTLNIANNFSVSKGTDIRNIADQITGHINDRLRDSVINLGG